MRPLLRLMVGLAVIAVGLTVAYQLAWIATLPGGPLYGYPPIAMVICRPIIGAIIGAILVAICCGLYYGIKALMRGTDSPYDMAWTERLLRQIERRLPKPRIKAVPLDEIKKDLRHEPDRARRFIS